MYKKEKPILLKGSTSALNNNLSVLAHPEKGNIQYAIVHKSVVNLVTCALDGSSVSHRQIICKEPSATHGASMVMQVREIVMGLGMLSLHCRSALIFDVICMSPTRAVDQCSVDTDSITIQYSYS